MERSTRFKIWVISEKNTLKDLPLGGPYLVVKESWKYPL